MNSFDRRMRAFCIDTSAAAILVMALVGLDFIDPAVRGYLAIAIYFGVFCLPYLAGKGQTFGKRTQKVKVVWATKELVPTEYKVPNRFYLILRQFVICLLILTTFGAYMIIGAIISTGRQDGRTIHDFIFKTRVVPITRHVTDGVELKNGQAASNSLKGYGPYDD